MCALSSDGGDGFPKPQSGTQVIYGSETYIHILLSSDEDGLTNITWTVGIHLGIICVKVRVIIAQIIEGCIVVTEIVLE